MIDRSEVEEVLFKVIRGVLPISALNNVGVLVSFERCLESTIIKITSEVPLIISPTVSDIVQGLTSISIGHDLKEWASFILATDLIDLDEVEKHSQSDELIGCLWDASFNGFVDKTLLNRLI